LNNRDGTNSRDFTYIDNVIQMNHLAGNLANKAALKRIFNTTVGERNDINKMGLLLKQDLAEYNPAIA